LGGSVGTNVVCPLWVPKDDILLATIGLVAASEKPYTIDFGTSFGITAYMRGFEKQAEFLATVQVGALPERLKKCGLLVWGITEDSKAICSLVGNSFPNQAYILYRALLEKIVTLFYLQVVSEEVFQDYLRYSLHKSYAKVKTLFEVETKNGPVRFGFPGEIDLSEYPDVEAARKRFTSSTGKPLTRWDNTSIQSKVSKIKEAALIDTAFLEMLLFFVYDDASEAMHATLYGSVFHYNVFAPPNHPDDIEQELKDRLFSLMWMGSMIVFMVNEWLLGPTGQHDVLEEARDLNNLLMEHMKRAVQSPG